LPIAKRNRPKPCLVNWAVWESSILTHGKESPTIALDQTIVELMIAPLPSTSDQMVEEAAKFRHDVIWGPKTARVIRLQKRFTIVVCRASASYEYAHRMRGTLVDEPTAYEEVNFTLVLHAQPLEQFSSAAGEVGSELLQLRFMNAPILGENSLSPDAAKPRW
jgi:hypothetical protein